MSIVTSDDRRRSSRSVYIPPRTGMAHRAYLSPDRRWVLVAEMEASAWLPCRLVPFDGRSRGRASRPPGRQLHVGGLVARWSVDVPQCQCRRRLPSLAAGVSRWPAGTNHGRPRRRGGHRDGAGRPLADYVGRDWHQHHLDAGPTWRPSAVRAGAQLSSDVLTRWTNRLLPREPAPWSILGDARRVVVGERGQRRAAAAGVIGRDPEVRGGCRSERGVLRDRRRHTEGDALAGSPRRPRCTSKDGR